MRGKAAPFPDAVSDRKGWSVKRGAPASDLEHRVMSVPDYDGLDSHIRNQRMHEMLHAAFTEFDNPVKLAQKWQIPEELIQVAEDLRLHYNYNIRYNRYNPDSTWDNQSWGDGFLTWEQLQQFADSINKTYDTDPETAIKDAMLSYMSMNVAVSGFRHVPQPMINGKAKLDAFEDLFRPELKGLLDPVTKRTKDFLSGLRWGNDISSKKLEQIARFLDSIVPRKAVTPPPEPTKAQAEALKKKGIKPFDPDEDPTPHKIAHKGSGGIQWAKMRMVYPPLTQSRAMYKSAVVKYSMDSGVVIRHLHRALTDGRVFERRAHVLGGTVLIDVSGSMGLSIKQIEEIMLLAPGATVATYSGGVSYDSADPNEYYIGDLRIVAKAGRVCAPDQLRTKNFGDNFIDGPALEWLNTQAEPRFWVSDVQPTAPHGDFDSLAVECLRHVRKGRVRIVESAAAAVELFRKMRGGR